MPVPATRASTGLGVGLGVACADGSALGPVVADGVGDGVGVDDAEAVGVGVVAGAQSDEVRRPSHVRVTAAESPALMRSIRLVGSAGQVVEVHTVSVPEAMTAPRLAPPTSSRQASEPVLVTVAPMVRPAPTVVSAGASMATSREDWAQAAGLG